MADQLVGIALRRAVAEAVGWPEETADQLLTWDWAIAACESAGMGTDYRVVIGDSDTWIQKWTYPEWVDIGLGEGVSPESLCRALFKALEAREDQAPRDEITAKIPSEEDLRLIETK